MSSCTSSSSEKLRVLLIPFFATSHIQPFTELAIRLAAVGAVEATVGVTPANVSIVQSLLERRGQYGDVKIATYPFPVVDGLPRGVENLGKVGAADAWRIDDAALSDTLMRPPQDALIRAQCPDAIVTDMHFAWNAGIADELGVPCVAFSVVGAFPALALGHLMSDDHVVANDKEVVSLPFPRIQIPRSELPEFLRSLLRDREVDSSATCKLTLVSEQDCFGMAMNTSSELEQHYCDVYTRLGYAKRAYFLGPLSLGADEPNNTGRDSSPCISWLDSRADRSVVYLCFGSLAHVSAAQLDELALGLEASGKPFLWVVRAAEEWTPPAGWVERVKHRETGLLVRAWAPQTAILGHPAVGAFVTHCGWNSVLETVAAGVPVLTWPMVFEQFIIERLLTEVLRVGERLWPEGHGRRSTSYQEHELVPAQDVARSLTTFMRLGGPGDAARIRAMDLAAKAHAAMAEGGSSHRDLHRLVDDLRMAAANKRTT